MSRLNTIAKRQKVEKELLIAQLKKTPIVQVACEKVGVGRSTFYRWKNEDPKFRNLADQAIRVGEELLNDLAESQLINLIRDKRMDAIRYWLTHHHPTYGNKLQITGRLLHENIELSDEQKELVEKALRLASLDQDYEES